jgi:hypothetical protein
MLRGARRRLVRWETGSRGARAPRGRALRRAPRCARGRPRCRPGSGSHVPMWVARRALPDWVTLIARRVVRRRQTRRRPAPCCDRCLVSASTRLAPRRRRLSRFRGRDRRYRSCGGALRFDRDERRLHVTGRVTYPVPAEVADEEVRRREDRARKRDEGRRHDQHDNERHEERERPG